MDFKTVRRYWRADSVEQLVVGGVRASKLVPFKPHLHLRLTAGARSATALNAEIGPWGYTGSYNTIERYLKPLRRSYAATLAQVLRTGRRRCGRSRHGSPACLANSTQPTKHA